MKHLSTRVSLPLFLLPLILPACGRSEASVAGTYVMDPEAMKAVIEEAKKEAKSDDPMAAMMAQMMDALKDAKIEMTLKDDGTYDGVMEMTFLGMNKKSARTGTWKLEADKLTVTTTHEDGKPLEKQEVKQGTFKDGQIRITETLDKGSGRKIEFVMTRKMP